MEVTADETGGDAHAGFGKDNKAFFWIGGGGKPKGGTHVALRLSRGPTSIRSTARLWPPAAGTMGAPGLRPHYHPDYYGAFVLDPDGNNIEAACRKPA